MLNKEQIKALRSKDLSAVVLFHGKMEHLDGEAGTVLRACHRVRPREGMSEITVFYDIPLEKENFRIANYSHEIVEKVSFHVSVYSLTVARTTLNKLSVKSNFQFEVRVGNYNRLGLLHMDELFLNIGDKDTYYLDNSICLNNTARPVKNPDTEKSFMDSDVFQFRLNEYYS